MGRSSAQSECVKPKEGMRSLRAGFQTEGCEINLVGQEQHFKKKKKMKENRMENNRVHGSE